MSEDVRLRFDARQPDSGRHRANRAATLLAILVFSMIGVVAMLGIGLVFAHPSAPPAAAGHQLSGDTPLDFTVVWGYVFVGGIGILLITLGAWYFGSGVGADKIAGGAGLGVLVIVVAVFGAYFNVFVPAAACVTNCTPSQIAGTGAVAVSLIASASYPAGQTLVVSPLSLTVDTVMNASTAAGAMCLQNGAGATHACAATAHNYIVIPVKLSRTDNYNATLGWTVCLNSITTLTNSSTGITYSSIGYVPSTTASPGIWKVQWSTGSIGGANPTQPAPATLSGVACDLVGVPAFGSTTVTLSVSLPGSNATSANIGYLETQYSDYPFSISITGGAGATPATIPVNIIDSGIKNA